jgi:hypothetical protein
VLERMTIKINLIDWVHLKLQLDWL